MNREIAFASHSGLLRVVKFATNSYGRLLALIWCVLLEVVDRKGMTAKEDGNESRRLERSSFRSWLTSMQMPDVNQGPKQSRRIH
jgi:hypothetical protein